MVADGFEPAEAVIPAAEVLATRIAHYVSN